MVGTKRSELGGQTSDIRGWSEEQAEPEAVAAFDSPDTCELPVAAIELRRNLLTAMIPKRTKSTSTTSCVCWNGGSDSVGANQQVTSLLESNVDQMAHFAKYASGLASFEETWEGNPNPVTLVRMVAMRKSFVQ